MYKVVIVANDPRTMRLAQNELRAVDDVLIAGVALDAAGVSEMLRVTEADVLVANTAVWPEVARAVMGPSSTFTAKVIALSGERDRESVAGLVASGVDVVVQVPTRSGTFAQAIRAVLADVTFVTAPLVDEGRRLVAKLSERERDVLRAISDGMSNAEIADELVIGKETVKFHVSALLRKARIRDRQMLIVMAHRLGLVGRGSERPWLRYHIR
ncbi:response regulator transcription factor [Myceligenerans cantabricum]